MSLNRFGPMGACQNLALYYKGVQNRIVCDKCRRGLKNKGNACTSKIILYTWHFLFLSMCREKLRTSLLKEPRMK